VITVDSVGSTARVRVWQGSGSSNPGLAALEAYVTNVYRDLFDRAVDPVGLSGWTNALATGTPRVAVANGITYSREYRATLITGSYQQFLDRTPDPQGLDGWLSAMGRGVTIQQMEGGFLASDEYYANAGFTDASWVTALYRHVLGRTPSAAENQAWSAAIARTGRYQVAMGFLLSSEYLGTVVNALYVKLLGRGIDPTGRQGWVTAIQRGERLETVIGGIIASDEYFGKG
jgi:hypothetical protein